MNKLPCSTSECRYPQSVTCVSTLWSRVVLFASSILLFIPGAILFSSCTSSPRDRPTDGPASVSRTLVLSPEVASAKGLAGSAEREVPAPAGAPDSSSVLCLPRVHAYSIGRYIDGADPDLMHESHLVYRRETSPRWRFEHAPASQILVGPKISEQAPDTSAIRSKELDALLLELRKTGRENRDAIELLLKAVDALSRRLEQERTSKPGDQGSVEKPQARASAETSP